MNGTLIVDLAVLSDDGQSQRSQGARLDLVIDYCKADYWQYPEELDQR
jgi:hypothetical protein